MANETVARRYAVAIFQLAQECGDVDRVGHDLLAISSGIYDDPVTKEFFLSPVVDRKEKERILGAAFSGKAHEVALHSLLLLVRKRREALLREISRQYAMLETQARGSEPLTVMSAKQLSPEQLRDLVSRLEKVYDKQFDVTQRVDPKLIGGVRIVMGDRRVDGSVAGRLEELTRTLFAKN
ncbi:MAG TPA: ATP synthase F1 subunit delta [Candidatus Baltobacteraceae bacterium]|jgi:F-type H+-transporting ATPase subunit delta